MNILEHASLVPVGICSSHTIAGGGITELPYTVRPGDLIYLYTHIYT